MIETNSSIDQLLSLPPFVINEKDKSELFKTAIFESFNHHIKNNPLFRQFCAKSNLWFGMRLEDLSDYPYLPVDIFKKRNLCSVPANELKTFLYSSATTGIPSTIAIDSITSRRQITASTKIMIDYLGSHRRPFLVLDEDPSKTPPQEISARSAAVRGFLMLASSADYFLRNTDGQLAADINKFQGSLKKFEANNEEVCIFGFTFVLYENFIKALKENKLRFHLAKNSKVLHIGGWKKLEHQKVSRVKFINDIRDTLGVAETDVFDFYGFTEQMGIIYSSIGDSPKTTPLYSELIIRDFQTLQPVKDGEIGLIQILTPLPHSYPGISVLTEDVGRIVGRGSDRFGREGTQFEVLGRAEKAEARGCGDMLSEFINRSQV